MNITKQELIKIATEKTKKKEAEIVEMYNECEKEIKDRLQGQDISAKDIEKNTILLLHAKLKKELKSNAETFMGTIIGVSDITTFGADKLFAKHKEIWETDKQMAIECGYTTKEGAPLFLSPDWRKGQKIDVERAKGKKIFFLVNRKDNQDYLIFGSMVLSGQKLDTKIPLYKDTTFRANISKKSTDSELFLNQSTITEFTVLDNQTVDFPALIKKYLKGYTSSMESLDRYYKKVESSSERLVIVKGNVVRIGIGEKSNVIELDDIELGLDVENVKTITVWAHKSLPIDHFSELTPGVIVFGRLNYNIEKDSYSINAYGIWCPKEWEQHVIPESLSSKTSVIEEESIIIDNEAW